MSPLLAALLILLAQAPDPDAALLDVVRGALRNKPDLAWNHAGYVQFVAAHNDVAAAEEAFSELSVLAGFGEVVGDFDEALLADPVRQELFDGCCGALARDPALSAAVDAVHRWELEQGRRNDAVGSGLDYLRAHPADALRFLDVASRLAPLPEPLRELDAFLKNTPSARAELLAALNAVDRKPLAHTYVYPWWQALDPTGGSAVAARHARMQTYFRDHPQQFWVWDRYQTALASQPHARDWIRYWRRLVRRTPELACRYDPYLRALRQHPESRSVEDTSREDAPLWPPDTPPPAPEPLPAAATQSRVPLKQDLMPSRPQRPVVERPTRPAMPTMPDRPQKPDKPDKPPISQTQPQETPAAP